MSKNGKIIGMYAMKGKEAKASDGKRNTLRDRDRMTAKEEIGGSGSVTGSLKRTNWVVNHKKNHCRAGDRDLWMGEPITWNGTSKICERAREERGSVLTRNRCVRSPP